MSMTKKDFVALADELRPIFADDADFGADSRDEILSTLCRFMQSQNPQFKRQRWLDYLAEKCGPGGGDIKRYNARRERWPGGGPVAPRRPLICPPT